MNIEITGMKCRSIIDAVGKIFVAGDDETLKKILCGIISGGHILFEDNPGLGKTLLVKVFAGALGCNWKRIQFTPDILPSDIVGTKVWKGTSSEFELEKGPVFTNILLADEINRAMPKTQSALLESMEEKQVTIEGETHSLGPPFIVMATQNPIEMEGTYTLPEAQVDRFSLKLSLGYLKTLEEECQILKRRIEWGKDDPSEGIAPVVTQDDVVLMQQEAERVYVDDNIIKYICEIVRKTRNDKRIMIGSSPRGGLSILKLSRAYALINGRDFVVPDDVKELAQDVLAHRIKLNIEFALEGLKPRSVVKSILSTIDVPKNFTRSE